MSAMPATATASCAALERKKEAMIVQKAMSSRFTPPMSARPRPECGAAAPTVRRKSETTEPSGGFVV